MSYHAFARLLGLSAACSLLASAASGQGFSYPDFSSITGLALNEDALQVGSALRVTPATGNQHGSVWYDQLVSVNNGFETTFEFQFSNLNSTGADGMAFVIQNDPRGTLAIGDLLFGTPLSYAADPSAPPGTAIANSLAIELDTWLSGNAGDQDDNHISIHTGGAADNDADESMSLGRVSPATDLNDTGVHTMRVSYVPGTLDVYLDDLVTPILSVPYDFMSGGTYVGGLPAPGMNLVSGEFAYVGFTAATGGVWEDHDLISWSYDASALGMSYCGPAFPNSTGQAAIIEASGSSSTAADDVTLIASQLPPGQFGYFLAGQTQGFFNPPGSQGIICLTGNIGRYNAVPDIIQGPTGSLQIALGSIPVNPPTAVMPGDTWNFQCWYRDLNPTLTSNFTDGLTITFF